MKEKEKQELVKKIEKVLNENGLRGAKLIFEEEKLPSFEEIRNEKTWIVEVLGKWADKALVQIKGGAISVLVWAFLSLTGLENKAESKLHSTYQWAQEKVYEFIENPPFHVDPKIQIQRDFQNYGIAINTTSTGTSGTARWNG